MNKIYKVIWSKVKHQYVVVSELAHSNGKQNSKSERTTVSGSLRALAAALVVSGSLLAIPYTASAAEGDTVYQIQTENGLLDISESELGSYFKIAEDQGNGTYAIDGQIIENRYLYDLGIDFNGDKKSDIGAFFVNDNVYTGDVYNKNHNVIVPEIQHTITNEDGFHASNGKGTYNTLNKDGLWVGGTQDGEGFHVDNDGNVRTTENMMVDKAFYAGDRNFVVDEDGNLSAAGGNFTIDKDGTTYAHAGRSELQVTEDQAVLRHGDNGVIVNKDGVAVAGELTADNGLKAGLVGYDEEGNAIYGAQIGQDGSLSADNGQFVAKNGMVNFGNVADGTGVLVNSTTGSITATGSIAANQVIGKELGGGNGAFKVDANGKMTTTGEVLMKNDSGEALSITNGGMNLTTVGNGIGMVTLNNGTVSLMGEGTTTVKVDRNGTTFGTLLGDKTTTINGDTITTGTVNATKVTADEGTIGGVELKNNGITLSDNIGSVKIEHGAITTTGKAQSTIGGVKFQNGNVTADKATVTDLIQVGNSQNPLETTRIDGGAISTGEIYAGGGDFHVDKTGAVTTNKVAGLENTTWNGTTDDVSRAATEGQLKDVDTKVNQNTDDLAKYKAAGIIPGGISEAGNGIALGEGSSANAGSIAIGKMSWAMGKDSVALGNDVSVGGNDAVAIGNNINKVANNSVALGNGSAASRENTVSVGSSGNERQITNVAAGTEDTDAVNYGQLEDVAEMASAAQTEAEKHTTMTVNGGTVAPAVPEGATQSDYTDGNLQLKQTVTDGQIQYDVKLNDNISLGDGKITLNGAPETEDADLLNVNNAFTVGQDGTTTVTNGNTTMTVGNNDVTFAGYGNGTTTVDGQTVTAGGIVLNGEISEDGVYRGTITGLTNTTTDYDGFATAGRAATEEQLQKATNGIVKWDENTDNKLHGVTLNAGDVISGVDGKPQYSLNTIGANVDGIVRNDSTTIIEDNTKIDSQRVTIGDPQTGVTLDTDGKVTAGELHVTGHFSNFHFNANSGGNFVMEDPSGKAVFTVTPDGNVTANGTIYSGGEGFSNEVVTNAIVFGSTGGNKNSLTNGMLLKNGGKSLVEGINNNTDLIYDTKGMQSKMAKFSAMTNNVDWNAVNNVNWNAVSALSQIAPMSLDTELAAEDNSAPTREPDETSSGTSHTENGVHTGGGNTNNLHVTGDAQVDGSLTVKGESTFDGNATFNGKVEMNNDLNMNGNKITGIGEGSIAEGSTDAVTGGQLFDMQSGLNSRMDNIENRMNNVEDRIDKVGAMAAAIANLRTMGYDPEAPTEIAVGVGQYKSETGLALGIFHYPNQDFMLSASISTSGDEVMGGIGATWKLGRKSAAEREKDNEEKILAKAEEIKQAAKRAEVKAQADRHAQLLAEREAAGEPIRPVEEA